MSPMIVSKVQKMGGLPGSLRHGPNDPGAGLDGAGLYCDRKSSKSIQPRFRAYVMSYPRAIGMTRRAN